MATRFLRSRYQVLAALAAWGALTVPASAEKVVVRLAFWGGQDDYNVNQQLEAAFEQRYPNIDVQLEHIPSSYDDKIMTMIAGGSAPDVIELAEGFGTYASKGLIMPLDGFVSGDPAFSLGDFFPLVVDAYRQNGKLYTIPMRWGPMILYYNLDLFDRSAVGYPTRDWTWDDFLSAAKKLTRGEGPNKTYGIGSTGGWWPWWMTPVYQNGGQVLNDARTETLLDRPEAIEALEWYKALQWEHHVSPVGSEWERYPGQGPDQLFENSVTAMNQTGFWAVYWLRQKDIRWDVAFLPMQKRRATPLFSNGWAITSQSRHPREAWQLITFLTGPLGQQLVARSGHDVPVRRSVALSEAFLRPGVPPRSARLILEAADHLYAPPVTPVWNDMLGLMGREIDRMLRNEISAREAVANFKPAVDRLLRSVAR